jgi:hypothetical protein
MALSDGGGDCRTTRMTSDCSPVVLKNVAGPIGGRGKAKAQALQINVSDQKNYSFPQSVLVGSSPGGLFEGRSSGVSTATPIAANRPGQAKCLETSRSWRMVPDSSKGWSGRKKASNFMWFQSTCERRSRWSQAPPGPGRTRSGSAVMALFRGAGSPFFARGRSSNVAISLFPCSAVGFFAFQLARRRWAEGPGVPPQLEQPADHQETPLFMLRFLSPRKPTRRGFFLAAEHINCGTTLVPQSTLFCGPRGLSSTGEQEEISRLHRLGLQK